jgi:6-pyruvoyl-tetrahydropterin synthase
MKAYGSTLNEEGVLLDITVLQDAAHKVIMGWNETCLDDLPELRGINTTVEQLASHIHEKLSTELGSEPGIDLEVRVWESPESWGAFRT